MIPLYPTANQPLAALSTPHDLVEAMHIIMWALSGFLLILVGPHELPWVVAISDYVVIREAACGARMHGGIL